jgi:hypothetical protein
VNNKIDIKYLLKGYIANSLIDDEKSQLLEALHHPECIKQFADLIPELQGEAPGKDIMYDEEKVKLMIQNILKHSISPRDTPAFNSRYPENMAAGSTLALPLKPPRMNSKSRVFLFLRKGWMRYAAAVIVLGTIGLYGYYRSATFSAATAKEAAVKQTEPADDALPGSDKAILTLSNGEKVLLDAAAQNVITDEGVPIHNTNGSLSYGKSNTTAFNTMETPKGGQYRLALSDGTIVWLNAASSITYPVSFSGKTRVVSITGEAYFEVAKNASKPFIVKTYKDEITVRGTSFNINSYADEPGIKTSLLEGLVEINQTLLKPGDAYIAGKIVKADLEKELAWKNGVFNFHHVKLADAMRQIARWYNVEVRYEGNVGDIELGGEIGRNLTLKQLLNGLQDKDIHFSLQDRLLTVSHF